MQVGFPQKSTFGTLTATKIICPEYDSVGVTVLFKRAGSERIVLGSVKTEFKSVNLRLRSNIAIEDNTGVILGTDNLQHIDDLGRMDAVMTSLTASHKIFLSANEIGSIKVASEFDEVAGSWLTAGNDVFYGWLSQVLHFLSMKGAAYIETIEVFMNSGHNDAYIDVVTLHRRPLGDATRVEVATEPDDIGNGSTGADSGVLTVNHEVLTDSVYSLEIQCVVPSTNVKIYGIGISYHMV